MELNSRTRTASTLLAAYLLGTLLTLFNLPAAASPRDFYVNADPTIGDNGNPGDNPNDPKRTINAAIGIASNGDTIHIADGIYRESISTDRSITFLGESAAGTILHGCQDSSCSSRRSTGIASWGGTQMVVKEMTVTEFLYKGIGVDDASTQFTGEMLRITANLEYGLFVGSGSVDLSRVDISNNLRRASHLNPNANLVQIENTTISGNGFGFVNSTGGIAMAANFIGIVEINNSTISNNKYLGFSTYTTTNNISNSIIAGNVPGASFGGDCYVSPTGGITSLGNNIDQDNSCGFIHTDDLNSSEPKLAPLVENQSALRTHGLKADSPALDKGNPAKCPSVDQRGVARPIGAVCDIGAHEGIIDAGILLPIRTPGGAAVVPL